MTAPRKYADEEIADALCRSKTFKDAADLLGMSHSALCKRAGKNPDLVSIVRRVGGRPTRALSIRQPWAWLIVQGFKTIENRSRRSAFRGDFFVHASKYSDARYYDEAVALTRLWAPDVVVPPAEALRYGGIVGRARMVDVLPPEPQGASLRGWPCESAWRLPGQFGYVLEDAAELPFEPMAGRIYAFWDVASDPPRKGRRLRGVHTCPRCGADYLKCGCDR